MAVTVVQSKLGEGATSATTLATGSFGSNVTSGNILWITTNSGATATATITKNSGTATIGTVTEQGSSQEVGTLEELHHFTCPITGTGSLDLLVTYGSSQDNRSILAFELTGYNSVLGQAVGTDTGNNPTNNLTVNVTAQPATVFAIGTDVQGGTYGVGTGYTNVGTFGVSVHNNRVQTKAVTSTGNTTSNFVNASFDRGVYAMVVFDDAASGVTGTLARTNANDTSSATGTTTVVGSLAKTNVNDTSSATGTTTIVGSLARTNANDTSAAQGTTTVVGSLATTNANDTISASGSVGAAVSGTLAVTNANDTSAATGTTTVTGTLAKTNVNDTSSASGTTTILGTLTTTNGNDTLAASGTSGTPVVGTGTRLPLTGAGAS